MSPTEDPPFWGVKVDSSPSNPTVLWVKTDSHWATRKDLFPVSRRDPDLGSAHFPLPCPVVRGVWSDTGRVLGREFLVFKGRGRGSLRLDYQHPTLGHQCHGTDLVSHPWSFKSGGPVYRPKGLQYLYWRSFGSVRWTESVSPILHVRTYVHSH